jgi:hypothetical protein
MLELDRPLLNLILNKKKFVKLNINNIFKIKIIKYSYSFLPDKDFKFFVFYIPKMNPKIPKELKFRAKKHLIIL